MALTNEYQLWNHNRESRTYSIYLVGVAAMLGIALTLFGLRGMMHEGPRRCPAIMLYATLLSGFLACYLIANGAAEAWCELVSESIRAWWPIPWSYVKSLLH